VNRPRHWLAALSIGFGLAGCSAAGVLRVASPEMAGLHCGAVDICVEDPQTLTKATALADDAVAFVTTKIGPLKKRPAFLFCSTRDCFADFANPQVAAVYFWGTDTIVVNAIGWHPHILRHEVIHHWQAETFGAMAPISRPSWYIEGMAYTLSEDPRAQIPHAAAAFY